jgi:molybdopterin-guanine dinucleotide biosynthesis protein A
VKKLLHKDFYDSIILAGGYSIRFGSDKCEFCISGKSMLQRVAEIFDFPIIISNIERKIDNKEFKIIIDRERKGPLRAIKYAFPFLTKDKVFITGCDFPFITKELVNLICNKDYDIVLPLLEYPQPLLGCYKTSFIESNYERVNSFVDLINLAKSVYLIGTEEIKIVDPLLNSVLNINRINDILKKENIFTKSKIILK